MDHVPRTALLLLAVAVLMALGCALTLVRMLVGVKARLPKGEKLTMLGFNQNTVLKAYVRYFPNRRLVRLYWVLLSLMLLSMLLSAWSLNMFR
jgi:hypothetical protein